jgi:DNA-binding IclR family transcriptional regulator
MKNHYKPITMNIDASAGEVQLVFSTSITEARMTPDEADAHAKRLVECAQRAREHQPEVVIP